MTASEEIKIIYNKVDLNKAQDNLDIEKSKIPALSSGNVGKYAFLIGKEVLPERGLLEKAATIKRF